MKTNGSLLRWTCPRNVPQIFERIGQKNASFIFGDGNIPLQPSVKLDEISEEGQGRPLAAEVVEGEPEVVDRHRRDRALHETWVICTRRAGKLYKARSRLAGWLGGIEAKFCK